MNATLVDLYVSRGNSAALKKSAARKCSSRERARVPLSLSPVLIDAASIASSMEPDFATRSSITLPVVLSKRPYIVDTGRSIEKLGYEWYESTV